MTEQQSKFMQAAKLWAAAAWSDGVISDEERIGMAVIIKLAELDDDDEAIAMRWLESKVDVDDLNLAGTPIEDRRQIYTSAVRVTLIDKTLADTEKLFLARLRDALDIDDATADELHKDIPGMS